MVLSSETTHTQEEEIYVLYEIRKFKQYVSLALV
jgi:hypothetical protein